MPSGHALNRACCNNIITDNAIWRRKGLWSSGYDIALTQRRPPVQIRPSPFRKVSKSYFSRGGRYALNVLSEPCSGKNVSIYNIAKEITVKANRFQLNVDHDEIYRIRRLYTFLWKNFYINSICLY